MYHPIQLMIWSHGRKILDHSVIRMPSVLQILTAYLIEINKSGIQYKLNQIYHFK